jgi:hypothetical protein
VGEFNPNICTGANYLTTGSDPVIKPEYVDQRRADSRPFPFAARSDLIVLLPPFAVQ